MIELLQAELKARAQSIALFKLNIDKFSRMLAMIGPYSPPSLINYMEELRGRIASEQAALDREELIHAATAEILAELETG
jgi:hypothetical protein